MEQVKGDVWSNSLIFLIHWLFGITHLESMFCLRRSQVCPRRNWKRFQRQIIKDAGPFPKISFFRCFTHIFAITKQLSGFSISRLASVEDFYNVHIFFKCKYMCKYERLFISIYLSSLLLKISFFLPHVFCNIEFDFSWFYNTKQSSEILIVKIEMLLEF